jgi:probable rRNA maturation factor
MADAVEIETTVEDPDWTTRAFDAEVIAARAAMAALDQGEPRVTAGSLAVTLTSDAVVQDLNRRWRSIDKPTNVLSFPGDDPREWAAAPGDAAGPPPHWGDVILAFGTIAREADEQAKRLEDHLSHLVVHGVLHLLGYDHEDESDAETMEQLEIAILARLGIADPYRDAGQPTHSANPEIPATGTAATGIRGTA